MHEGRVALHHPAASTILAVVTIPGLSAIFLLLGLQTLILSGRTARPLFSAPAPDWVNLLLSVAVVATGFLAIALAQGILRRISRARQAASAMLAVFGISVLLGSFMALTIGDVPNAAWGLVVGLVNCAVVVLLELPSTRRDFERADRLRYQARRSSTGRFSVARASQPGKRFFGGSIPMNSGSEGPSRACGDR